MSLFDVLAQLLQIFVDLIPRISPRPQSTEWCVTDSFLFGPQVTWSRPVIVWPILDHVEFWPRTEIPCASDIQTCVTADDRTITVETAFAYQIFDPLVVRENWGSEHTERVVMAVRGAVEDAHSGCNWDEIRTVDHERIVEHVTKELEGFGVELTYFCVEDSEEDRG